MWGNRWNVWVLTISATGKSFYYIHFTDKKIRTGKCGNLGCHNQQPQIGWCDTWGSETQWIPRPVSLLLGFASVVGAPLVPASTKTGLLPALHMHSICYTPSSHEDPSHTGSEVRMSSSHPHVHMASASMQPHSGALT